MPMSRKSRRLAVAFVSAILLICWAILFFAATRENSNSVQRKLLSRITQETPVSGFYGPGAWWGFLITLGMTHGHAAMAIYKEGRIPPNWDYDLTSAAFYVGVAAVDLVLKSRTISQLGDPASQSNLIPALVCAERVVSLGTGSLLFTTSISLVYGSSSRHRLRIYLVTMIPLILALLASVCSYRAHEAISHSAPVFWCPFHDGSNRQSYTMVDYPGYVGQRLYFVDTAYASWKYWLAVGLSSGVATMTSFAYGLYKSNQRDHALVSALSTLFGIAAFSIAVPLIGASVLVGYNMLTWLVFWITAWEPIYLLAFFPQFDYFPPTNISIFEMDQIAALLAILIVAMIRSWLRIFGDFWPSDSEE